MSCSSCATFSLRSFLKALIKVELRATRPVYPSNGFTVSRRQIHNSSVSSTQLSPREVQDHFLLEQASSTNLNDTFLPFDEDVKARTSQEKAVDARPWRLQHSSMFKSAERTIHSPDIYGQERSLGPVSILLNHPEPQTWPSEEKSSAIETKWQQSFATELTGSNQNLSIPSPASMSTVLISQSARGFSEKDFPTVKHGVNGTPQPSSKYGMEAKFKNRDGKWDLSGNTSPSGKSVGLSSSTGRPRALGSTQTRGLSEYRQREPWQVQKSALKAKFGLIGWSPRKRLSPDAIEGIRALHAQYPDKYTTPILAEQFQVSSEAVRRILKSKWRANEEEESDRRQRWDKRGAAIWSKLVETGVKPPKKWREMGVGRGRNHLKVRRSGESGASAWDSGNAGQEAGLGTTLSDRIL